MPLNFDEEIQPRFRDPEVLRKEQAYRGPRWRDPRAIALEIAEKQKYVDQQFRGMGLAQAILDVLGAGTGVKGAMLFGSGIPRMEQANPAFTRYLHRIPQRIQLSTRISSQPVTGEAGTKSQWRVMLRGRTGNELRMTQQVLDDMANVAADYGINFNPLYDTHPDARFTPIHEGLHVVFGQKHPGKRMLMNWRPELIARVAKGLVERGGVEPFAGEGRLEGSAYDPLRNPGSPASSWGIRHDLLDLMAQHSSGVAKETLARRRRIVQQSLPDIPKVVEELRRGQMGTSTDFREAYLREIALLADRLRNERTIETHKTLPLDAFRKFVARELNLPNWQQINP